MSFMTNFPFIFRCDAGVKDDRLMQVCQKQNDILHQLYTLASWSTQLTKDARQLIVQFQDIELERKKLQPSYHSFAKIAQQTALAGVENLVISKFLPSIIFFSEMYYEAAFGEEDYFDSDEIPDNGQDCEILEVADYLIDDVLAERKSFFDTTSFNMLENGFTACRQAGLWQSVYSINSGMLSSTVFRLREIATWSLLNCAQNLLDRGVKISDLPTMNIAEFIGVQSQLEDTSCLNSFYFSEECLKLEGIFAPLKKTVYGKPWDETYLFQNDLCTAMEFILENNKQPFQGLHLNLDDFTHFKIGLPIFEYVREENLKKIWEAESKKTNAEIYDAERDFTRMIGEISRVAQVLKYVPYEELQKLDILEMVKEKLQCEDDCQPGQN